MKGTKTKIRIRKLATKQQRAVAFSKRRQGLFKKAADICVLYDAQVAVLASGPSEKSSNVFYTFGHSSVDNVVDAFLENRPPLRNTSTSHSGGTVALLERENVDKYKNPEDLAIAIENLKNVRHNLACLSNSPDDALPNLDEGFGLSPDLCVDGYGNAYADGNDAELMVLEKVSADDPNCPLFWKILCDGRSDASTNTSADAGLNINENAYSAGLMVAEDLYVGGPTNSELLEVDNCHMQTPTCADGSANMNPSTYANEKAYLNGYVNANVNARTSTSTSGLELMVLEHGCDGGYASPRFWEISHDICGEANSYMKENENGNVAGLMVVENDSVGEILGEIAAFLDAD